MAPTFEEVEETWKNYPIEKKIALSCAAKTFVSRTNAEVKASQLRWDGYLFADESKALRLGDGEHYVYMWSHAWGAPFYIGSGKGDRWIARGNRNNDFFRHLDDADAVVRKLVVGLDERTARVYEEYISINLSVAGIELANHDNNITGKNEKIKAGRMARLEEIAKLENTGNVENVLVNTLMKTEPNADFKTTYTFWELYGRHFFSNEYGSNRGNYRYGKEACENTHEPILTE